MSYDRLLSIREFSEVSNIPYRTVWLAVQDGNIPSTKIGKKRMIHPITLQRIRNRALVGDVIEREAGYDE